MKFFFLVLAICIPLRQGLCTEAVAPQIGVVRMLEGGMLDIPNGSLVEGSVGHGGTQPDYLVDLDDASFTEFLAEAAAIGRSGLDFWGKVDRVLRLVDQSTFTYFNYKNPYYLRLLKKVRDEGRPIKLSEYFSCRAGVCREFGLFTHFALKAAGIANHFVYAQIQRASTYHEFNIVEDHAFVVVKHDGKDWTVDPYYWGFNGFTMADLMRPEGITADSETAPIANPGPGFRRIIRINTFPKVWAPVEPVASPICEDLLKGAG